MITAKRYNDLAEKIFEERKQQDDWIKYGAVEATASQAISAFSVFSLRPSSADHSLPRLLTRAVDKSPGALFTNATDVPLGSRFLAQPLQCKAPSLLAGNLPLGSLCGPMDGYSIVSPGNAMFYCLWNWDAYSLVIQTNWVHSSVGIVTQAASANARGKMNLAYRNNLAIEVTNLEVDFFNRTSDVIEVNDVVKAKSTIGYGLVVSQ